MVPTISTPVKPSHHSPAASLKDKFGQNFKAGKGQPPWSLSFTFLLTFPQSFIHTKMACERSNQISFNFWYRLCTWLKWCYISYYLFHWYTSMWPALSLNHGFFFNFLYWNDYRLFESLKNSTKSPLNRLSDSPMIYIEISLFHCPY